MKIERNRTLSPGLLAIAVLGCVALTVPAVRRASAQVPAPFLTITQTDWNVFQIRITNAVASTNYELLRRPMFDTYYPWGSQIVGSIGQSNFNITNLIMEMEFFRAVVGSDWDGDGIPNSQDAQPTNSTIGTLTIIIDSPTNFTTIQ